MPDEGVATTVSLSTALAFVQGLEPENEAQAALAVNAACLHAASIKVLSRISSFGGDLRVVYMAAAAAKLERAFHSALATYHRIKQGSTQLIRVERIEVQARASAIVGQLRS